MVCSRVRNLLSAYCDRELTGADMLRIREHLQECAACRAEHDDLRRVKLVFGCLAGVEPRRPFSMQQVAAGRPSWSRLRLRWTSLAAPAVHLAGALAAAATRPVPPLRGYVAIGGAFTLSVLAVSLLSRPQSPDAVTAHVPETLSSEPLPPAPGPVLVTPAGFHSSEVLFPYSLRQYRVRQHPGELMPLPEPVLDPTRLGPPLGGIGTR